MNILAELRERFSRALGGLDLDPSDIGPLVEMVLPSQDARFGDYQANCAMPLGKRLGKPPRQVAQQLVDALEVDDLCAPPEVAGPGFINLRLRDEWIAGQAAAAAGDPQRLGVAPVAGRRTIVIDYSSPNVAKPMHVGHIRSTVIGDALYRVLAFLGHRVISDNHLGDWGTQFGMIIYGYKHFADQAAVEAGPVAELSRVYKLVQSLVDYRQTRHEKVPALDEKIAAAGQRLAALEAIAAPEEPQQLKKAARRIDQARQQLAEVNSERDSLMSKLAAVETDPQLGPLLAPHADVAEAVLRETALLHAGDATNVGLWRRFLPACLAEVNATYARLGVRFDHSLGESFYQDRLRGVVKELLDNGLARESDGAICVFLEGQPAPMIVQKQDGAFLYATTDLATIQYRMDQWQPDAILYVVDHRQSLHFEQLFATARRWRWRDVELQHVAFGTVLGEDGRPFKTRSGMAVGLVGLLDEAVQRAYAIVCQNDDQRPQPVLSDDERRRVAERVGIGAIKYADLAHNRTSDYVFSYDKMLAMTGNTAAYLQYSYARVRSIFAKSGIDAERLQQAGAAPYAESPITLCTSQERTLALSLLQLAETLDRVAADYRPNHLTAYLFELASRYSDFFENCPVIQAGSEPLRTSRLRLCDLTARTLQRGLHLLGIDVVERM